MRLSTMQPRPNLTVRRHPTTTSIIEGCRKKLSLLPVSAALLLWFVVAYFGSTNEANQSLLVNTQQQQQQPQDGVEQQRVLRHPVVTRNNVLVVGSNNNNNNNNNEPVFSMLASNVEEYLEEENAQGAGTQRPVVLRGVWEPPTEDWKTESSFLKAYGHIPYYIKDKYVQVKEDQCVAQFSELWAFITSPTSSDSNAKRSLLAFTNDKENTALFGEQGEKLPFDIPSVVEHIDSFTILSTMTKGQSHEFHKHGESWIAQAVGHKVWWFLPPTAKRPPKVNACDYLTGKETPPEGVTTTVQSPGDVIWFGQDWYHATCSLTDWTVGIGRQLGPRIRQDFKTLPNTVDNSDRNAVQELLKKCSGVSSNTGDNDAGAKNNEAEWKWYDGDLNKYYNDLEKDHMRNPNDINDFAVHRWMGEKRSTQVHYELIHESILKHYPKSQSQMALSADKLNVLDAGCGLGSALMWMETKQPSWTLEGRTLSEEQAKFTQTKLPKHNFEVKLGSFDNLEDGATYDAIYSIEAAIHSTDIKATLKAWSEHLVSQHGVLVIIDDFLQPGAKREDTDVDLFARSWLANALYTVTELNQIARKFGLTLVESRDLLAEYRIVELNYRNRVPSLDPDKQKNHQGWMGSKYRQKITVEGKLGYNLLVFRKMQ